MNGIELRRIGPEAAAELAALAAETFKLAYAELHAADDLEAYCAANYSAAKTRAVLESADHVCTVAYRGDAPVGFSVLRNASCPVPIAGPSAELKQVYVLPREFGAGAGRTLMDDALASVRRLGAQHAWLAVADINRRGPPFYLRYGFAYVGVGPMFEVGKDRVTSKIMALAL